MSTSNRTVSKSKSTAETVRHELDPAHDLIEYVKCYSREKPEVAALWCLGIGFVLGWKLKFW